MSERKLYVIVRRDMSIDQRVVMGLHVVAKFAYNAADPTDMADEVHSTEWTADGPPIIFMQVRDLHRLERLVELYGEATRYIDPDLNAGLCAIALYKYKWNHDWARMVTF